MLVLLLLTLCSARPLGSQQRRPCDVREGAVVRARDADSGWRFQAGGGRAEGEQAAAPPPHSDALAPSVRAGPQSAAVMAPSVACCGDARTIAALAFLVLPLPNAALGADPRPLPRLPRPAGCACSLHSRGCGGMGVVCRPTRLALKFRSAQRHDLRRLQRRRPGGCWVLEGRACRGRRAAAPAACGGGLGAGPPGGRGGWRAVASHSPRAPRPHLVFSAGFLEELSKPGSELGLN